MRYFFIFFCLLLNTAQARTPIAIIDTGFKLSLDKSVLCESGHKDLTGTTLNDINGHGTNIAGIIAQRMDRRKYCLVIIKWWHDEIQTRSNMDKMDDVMSEAVNHAVKYGAKLINMSLYGTLNLPKEKMAIIKALEKGVVVVVSSGNDGKNLSEQCDIFPACYPIKSPNFRIVANYQGNIPSTRSNINGPVTDKENGMNVEGYGYVMSGTSQSAAVLSGKITSK